MKNLIALHEAIALALLSKPDRKASHEEIALFIEKRNLYPNRKGNIQLSKQIMLRATKSSGKYSHLFKEVGISEIQIRNI